MLPMPAKLPSDLIMEVKVGILMILSLAALRSCGAIDSVTRIRSIDRMDAEFKASSPQHLEKSEKVCTYCEQSVAHAVEYFNGNNTQQQITTMLHASCSRLNSFSAECSKVVDYYMPIFVFELAFVKPSEVCEKLDLCETMEKEVESIRSGHNLCGTCREKVSDLLHKLSQRDTQLAFIETLGFGCKAMPTYVEKCVPMAYEYVPQVISDLEKYFEATDVCATYFGCKPAPNVNQKRYALDEEPLLSLSMAKSS